MWPGVHRMDSTPPNPETLYSGALLSPKPSPLLLVCCYTPCQGNTEAHRAPSIQDIGLPRGASALSCLFSGLCQMIRYPEGTSTQHLRFLVPNTTENIILETRNLKYWALGPSGLPANSRFEAVFLQPQTPKLSTPPCPAAKSKQAGVQEGNDEPGSNTIQTNYEAKGPLS